MDQERMRKEIDKIGMNRLTKFISSSGLQSSRVLAIRRLRRVIEKGDSLERELMTPIKCSLAPERRYGYSLSVEALEEDSFLITIGCQVGPTAGDGGTWQVDFHENDEIKHVSLKGGWVS